MLHMRPFTAFEERNLKFLTRKSIEHTLVQITATGYKKSILDATEPMRQYFLDHSVHDYSSQPQGPENKRVLPTIFLTENKAIETSTSLYRPVTKKGDPRIWPSHIKPYCQPDDILVLTWHEERFHIINLTHTDIERAFLAASPIRDLITAMSNEALSVSQELTALLRDLALTWHPAEVLADTGVGRSIESLLGIEMNCSPLPDYKGIELKSFREKRPSVRNVLFTKTPDWAFSHLHSTKEIVEKYGYMSNGSLTYQSTLRATSPNAQNLGLTLYQLQEILAIEEKATRMDAKGLITHPKVADVALWQLPTLHKKLLEKHHETFWIEVETRMENGRELFRPTMVEHTKNPVVSQFDSLIDAGYITVDLSLCRPSGHGDTVSFKMDKKKLPLLFPGSESIMLR